MTAEGLVKDVADLYTLTKDQLLKLEGFADKKAENIASTGADIVVTDCPGCEVQLIDTLSHFPAEVQRAAAEYKPLQITSVAYDLARAFNDFYNQCTVLKADPQVRAFRLRLVAASRQAIANALNLLGIIAPDVM